MNARDFILKQPEHLTVAAVCAKHQFQLVADAPEERAWGWSRDYGFTMLDHDGAQDPFVLQVNFNVHTKAGRRWYWVSVTCDAIGYRHKEMNGFSEKGIARWLDTLLADIEQMRPELDGAVAAYASVLMQRRFGF